MFDYCNKTFISGSKSKADKIESKYIVKKFTFANEYLNLDGHLRQFSHSIRRIFSLYQSYNIVYRVFSLLVLYSPSPLLEVILMTTYAVMIPLTKGRSREFKVFPSIKRTNLASSLHCIFDSTLLINSLVVGYVVVIVYTITSISSDLC